MAAAREVVNARIIPALAGNTGDVQQWGHVSSDHPRSRGEYDWSWENLRETMGSSPLSRGIRQPFVRP